MLSLYSIIDGRLKPADSSAESLAAWIDLLDPTTEEEKRVEKFLGIGIPTREEMAEIEVSSRLYRENDALYMTASLLVGGHTPLPTTCPVTFILAKDHLVTVRYADPSVFHTFPEQAQRTDARFKNADDVFLAFIEAIIDRTADILEKVAADIDALSTTIFAEDVENKPATKDQNALLRRLGRSGDLNSKVRESLVSTGRLVNFLAAECGDLHPLLHERTGTMSADIRSLADHASYLSNSSTFLLDALLGLINIEQNNIIKIVSVVSVLIMPPTLVASVYGMNFHFMPELDWRFGYPLAILAMILAAALPYWFFKRRGWL